MKYIFSIVILCVSLHALSFTYIKGMKLLATESIELEDMTEETDTEEDVESAKEHCPFLHSFSASAMFFASLSVRTVPTAEFIISHILPVESPPPRA